MLYIIYLIPRILNIIPDYILINIYNWNRFELKRHSDIYQEYWFYILLKYLSNNNKI